METESQVKTDRITRIVDKEAIGLLQEKLETLCSDRRTRRYVMPTVSDPCLYSQWVRDEQYLILVYMNDIMIIMIAGAKDSICRSSLN